MARDRGTAAVAPTVGPDGGATARLRLPGSGPHDAATLGADFTPAAGTLDFGAVRVPVPADGTVALEPSTEGRMQAVHVTFAQGRLSVSALAAPRNEGLWPDLATEIDASLREGGARVRSFTGAWGRELHATTDGATSVFIGVDGPRWMLYGVATGPTRDAVALDARLRRMLRGTVVVRGRAPYPVRTVLPLVAPSEVDADNPETPSQAPTMMLRAPAPSGAATAIGVADATATGVADATQASRPAESGRPRRIAARAKTNGVPQRPAASRGAAVNGAAVNGAAVNGAGVNGAAVNGGGVNGAAARTAGAKRAVAKVADGAVANEAVTTGGLTTGVNPSGAYPSGAYPSGAYPSGATPQGPATGSYWSGPSRHGLTTNGTVPNPAATSGAHPTGVPYGPAYGATPFGAATNGVASLGTSPPGPVPYGAPGATGAGPAGASTGGGYSTGRAAYGVPTSGAGPGGASTGSGYPTGSAAYGAPPATGGGPAGASTSGGYPAGRAAYGAPPATGAGPAGAATSGGYPTSAIVYGATDGGPPSGGATNGATPYGATPYDTATHAASTHAARPYGAPSSGGVLHAGALNGRELDSGVDNGEWSSVRPPGDWSDGYRAAADTSSRRAVPARWAHRSGSDLRSASPTDQPSPVPTSSTAGLASPSSSELPWARSDTADAAVSTSSGFFASSTTPPDELPSPATPVEPAAHGRASWADADPFVADPDGTSSRPAQFQPAQFQPARWDPLFDPLPGGLDPLPEPGPQWSDAPAAEPDSRRPAEPVGLDALPGSPLSTSGGWAAHATGEVAAEPGGRRRRESGGRNLPTEHGLAPRAGQRPGRRRASEASTTSVGRHEAGATPARHRDDVHPRHADAGSRHAALPASSPRVPPTQWAWPKEHVPKEPAHKEPADAEPELPTGRRAAGDTAAPSPWSAAELLDTRGNGGPRRRSQIARHSRPADPEAGRHQRP